MKNFQFKSVLTAFSLLLFSTLTGREANLINNSTFVFGMKCWKHFGSGSVKKLEKGVFVSGGTLAHYLDLGNLEHAQPACAAPAGRQFRFRIRARGKGKFQLAVRARVMYGGNALEFAELQSQTFELQDKFQNFDFESASTDFDTAFHDKLMVKLGDSSEAEIISSSFFYLDRKGPEISFEPAAAAVRPGDKLTITVRCSEPNRKLAVSLYTGQFLTAGYFPARHWQIDSGANGRQTVSFQIPQEAPDGVRLSVLDPESGVKSNFFASILPEKQLARYRELAGNISGKQHLLFLGDSLSDYDRGRNYISIAGCFLPESYSVRNCGVGGDTLLRIWQRLNGEKTTRNEMYDNIFSPNPDTIFIFTGANDSKLLSRNNYQTYVPEKDQIDLWDKIVTMLKKRTGAKIVLITSPDSYMPYQKALNQPLQERNYAHSVFGVPSAHDRFNARLKQIAAKHALDVIDFASVIRKYPDPQLLYVQDDGVHLSLKGHQLLAGEILRYLACGEKFTVAANGEKILKGKLAFDGNTKIRVVNSSDTNTTEKGFTVLLNVIPKDAGSDLKNHRPEALDMYIFKDRQFFIGRYGDRLYANFHDGIRYCAHTMSKPGQIPPIGKNSRIAAVFAPSSNSYSIKLYLNGQMVGQKSFTGKLPKSNNQFIELGSGWGGAWQYRGEIDGIRIFPRALSDSEVEKLQAR